MYTKDSNELTN